MANSLSNAVAIVCVDARMYARGCAYVYVCAKKVTLFSGSLPSYLVTVLGRKKFVFILYIPNGFINFAVEKVC